MNKLKIGTKFNVLVIAIIVFLSVVISLVAFTQVKKAMDEHFTTRVKVVSALGYNWLNQQYPGDWEVKNGDLFKGAAKISDNNEFVDEMGEITNGAVTIFLGDTRVATNITENGERAVGTKANSSISDKVLNRGEEFLGEADIVGKKYLTLYKPIKDKKGEIIGMWLVGPPIEVIAESVISLVLVIIAVLAGSGILAVIISVIFTRAIVRPISIMNDQLKEIAEGEGDLTKEIKVNTKDEVGELANSFNKMIDSLRKMIQQISVTSEQVAASSEELTASSEQMMQATSQISSSIQEVASGAEAQETGAEESSKAMNEMTIGMQRVASTASAVSEAAVETTKEANIGNELLQKVIQQMNAINTSVDQSSAVITQLGERSNEINKIIEVITAISSQTNLLALNAAIEAARAGEHGRGFAVVADEVKKLAEQSKQSADQISSLIKLIQEDTSRAVSSMAIGTKDVNEGMEVVTETGKGFQRILTSIEQVAAQIQEVSAVSEQMSAGIEQVNASIEETSIIAKVSTRNTQNVAAASQEQSASMEEITKSSASLSNMAEELQMLVNKFKV
ncbi:HAMP domain-containing protein [Bacillus sp. BGMRC 2118]|nr:HAMP domain-containing protein [Bacillus sp. BGMRC 2118]